MKTIDIDDEKIRTYIYSDTYSVQDPKSLTILENGNHEVEDDNEITHEIRGNWTAIQKSKKQIVNPATTPTVKKVEQK